MRVIKSIIKDIIKKKCLNGKDGGHDQGIQRPLRIGIKHKYKNMKIS